MTIVPDHELHKLCIDGLIDPYFLNHVEPASIDVRLGNKFRAFPRGHNVLTNPVDMDDPHDITQEVVVDEGGYFSLRPGELCLGATIERVCMPNDLVARIEGKSSVGRLGLAVHVTAGFIDPGFRGNVTLEMANLSPYTILLRPGKLIAQLSFHKMASACQTPYDGRYQGDEGPVASRYGQDHG